MFGVCMVVLAVLLVNGKAWEMMKRVPVIYCEKTEIIGHQKIMLAMYLDILNKCASAIVSAQ